MKSSFETQIHMSVYLDPVADTGFPVEGGGAPTSDTDAFQRKHR